MAHKEQEEQEHSVDKLAAYAFGHIESWLTNLARGAGVPESELASRVSALLSTTQGGWALGSFNRMPVLPQASANGARIRVPEMEVAVRPSSQLQSSAEGNEADSYARAPNIVKKQISRGIVTKMMKNGPVSAAMLYERYPQINIIAWRGILYRWYKDGGLSRTNIVGEYVSKPAKQRASDAPNKRGRPVASNEIKRVILDTMKGREKLTLGEMAAVVPGRKQHSLFQPLRTLISEGRIEKVGSGTYGPGKNFNAAE